VEKMSKNVKKLAKISQKFVQKFVKNVSQKIVNNLPFCSDCPEKKKKEKKKKKKKKKIGGFTRWRLRRTWKKVPGKKCNNVKSQIQSDRA
jgi:mRNA-degrading endonuclease RelE of RelBE toxin-antitoxin system